MMNNIQSQNISKHRLVECACVCGTHLIKLFFGPNCNEVRVNVVCPNLVLPVVIWATDSKVYLNGIEVTSTCTIEDRCYNCHYPLNNLEGIHIIQEVDQRLELCGKCFDAYPNKDTEIARARSL